MLQPNTAVSGRGKAVADIVGEAVARHYPQTRRHALEEDQHERPQGDDPQQRVAELAAAGHVGGPVARVDEADGDDEPRPQVAQEVAVEEGTRRTASRLRLAAFLSHRSAPLSPVSVRRRAAPPPRRAGAARAVGAVEPRLEQSVDLRRRHLRRLLLGQGDEVRGVGVAVLVALGPRPQDAEEAVVAHREPEGVQGQSAPAVDARPEQVVRPGLAGRGLHRLAQRRRLDFTWPVEHLRPLVVLQPQPARVGGEPFVQPDIVPAARWSRCPRTTGGPIRARDRSGPAIGSLIRLSSTSRPNKRQRLVLHGRAACRRPAPPPRTPRRDTGRTGRRSSRAPRPCGRRPSWPAVARSVAK